MMMAMAVPGSSENVSLYFCKHIFSLVALLKTEPRAEDDYRSGSRNVNYKCLSISEDCSHSLNYHMRQKQANKHVIVLYCNNVWLVLVYVKT